MKLAPALAAAGAKRAIVFGSYARGDADYWSDLDLLIIAETPLPFPDRFRIFPGLYEAYPHPLELFVYTPGEFAQMIAGENPFIEQILKDGVTIHEG